MTRRHKRRLSTPKQRVTAAAESDDKTVDFDYEEASEVLDLALERVRRAAETHASKIKDAVDTLHALSPTLRPPQEDSIEESEVKVG